MTFEQLQARLYKTVQRDDFLVANDADTNYGTFINEAIRECENRKSWTTMKRTGDFTILSGDSSVALPITFKEFQNVRPPVHIILDDPSAGGEILKPVNVTWAEQELRRLFINGGNVWDVQTWLERGSNGAVPPLPEITLNIASQAGEDLDFRIKYYAYSAELSGDEDESALANLYPRMVLMKAKEIAFEAINDYEALAPTSEQFELLFIRASMQDNRSDVAGREGRM